MSLIFVSYRRQDTQSATGRLCDKLQAHFGADQVFHDIESIEAGSDFTATITSKIQAFRDMWRISRLRFVAILTLVALVLSGAGALVAFAATL